MTPDERRAALVEKVARAMWLADLEPYDPADRIPFDEAPEVARAYCLVEATAALTVALEEAAKVAADPNTLTEGDGYRSRFNQGARIAAAIRALIPGSSK